jgi:hypothetical protein|tara:strand:+ start:1366 stop:1587 length:222 start_codon:yes stop_codon:yes gene_type:complete
MSEKIEDMIDAIGTKSLVNASDLFQELIQDKMQTALDQEKIAVADTVFNDRDEPQLELELDDDDGEDGTVDEQ